MPQGTLAAARPAALAGPTSAVSSKEARVGSASRRGGGTRLTGSASTSTSARAARNSAGEPVERLAGRRPVGGGERFHPAQVAEHLLRVLVHPGRIPAGGAVDVERLEGQRAPARPCPGLPRRHRDGNRLAERGDGAGDRGGDLRVGVRGGIGHADPEVAPGVVGVRLALPVSSAASHTSARSSGSRAKQPALSIDGASGRMPSMGSAPWRALSPRIPQKAAGRRIEPAVSVPSAANTAPVATATAEPPLEPPALCAGSCGFAAAGVVTPKASSWVVVLPTITAPAARSRATTGASRRAGASPGSVEPARVGRPSTSMMSLTPTGMPWSGPRGPAASSSARACARAPSSSSSANAPSAAVARARSRHASVSSTGPSPRSRTPAMVSGRSVTAGAPSAAPWPATRAAGRAGRRSRRRAPRPPAGPAQLRPCPSCCGRLRGSRATQRPASTVAMKSATSRLNSSGSSRLTVWPVLRQDRRARPSGSSA